MARSHFPLHPSRASLPLCNSITLHICTFVSSCRISGHGLFCCSMMLFRFVIGRKVVYIYIYICTQKLRLVSRLMVGGGSFLTAYGRVSCYKTFVIISAAIVLENLSLALEKSSRQVSFISTAFSLSSNDFLNRLALLFHSSHSYFLLFFLFCLSLLTLQFFFFFFFYTTLYFF